MSIDLEVVEEEDDEDDDSEYEEITYRSEDYLPQLEGSAPYAPSSSSHTPPRRQSINPVNSYATPPRNTTGNTTSFMSPTPPPMPVVNPNLQQARVREDYDGSVPHRRHGGIKRRAQVQDASSVASGSSAPGVAVLQPAQVPDQVLAPAVPDEAVPAQALAPAPESAMAPAAPAPAPEAAPAPAPEAEAEVLAEEVESDSNENSGSDDESDGSESISVSL